MAAAGEAGGFPEGTFSGWSRTARSWLGAASGEGRAGRVSRSATAVVLVAEAYLALLIRGARYAGRAGLSSALYGGMLASQLGAIGLGLRSDAVRVLIDESAAQLRELGELTVQEALSLQQLLRELAEQLRSLEDGTLDEPRRFARAKP